MWIGLTSAVQVPNILHWLCFFFSPSHPAKHATTPVLLCLYRDIEPHLLDTWTSRKRERERRYIIRPSGDLPPAATE